MAERTEEYKRQCVEQVIGIGFSEEQALMALQVSDYDVNRAAELIVQGGKCYAPFNSIFSRSNFFFHSAIQESDNEFDLIAAAPDEPKVRKPTVFQNKQQAKLSSTSDFGSTSSVGGDDVAEFEDSRISSLKEMGFTSQEAVDALIACDDDVNEALTYLLSRK